MQPSEKAINRLLVVIAVLLAGCVASPEWRHLAIHDETASQRQFTIDDGECTLISSRGTSSVPVAPAPTTSSANVTLQGSTYNTTTGQRTYGTYSGQVNTAPSGGFAGGFASGVSSGASLGAILAARQAEEKVYKSCMYSKGWTDKAVSVSQAASTKSPVDANASRVRMPAQPAPVYATPNEQWIADAKEFWRFYPAYASGEFFDRLNAKVKTLALAQDMTGPEYLIAALNQLRGEGKSAAEEITDSAGIRAIYVRAVQGTPADQAAMGLFYADGRDPRVPIDPVRSAYWSSKAALAGNTMGQLGYAIVLFSGIGVNQDKVNAYLWAKRAEAGGASVQSTLSLFESQMTPSELQAVR